MGSGGVLSDEGTFAIGQANKPTVIDPGVRTVPVDSSRPVSEEIVNPVASAEGGRWKSDPAGRRCIDKYPDTSDLFSTNYWHHVRAAHLPSGRTYRYVKMAAKDPSKPYLLLLHGFPSSSYDWRRQFDYFHRHGYGIIAPDTLGYGGTDKPEDLDAYRLKNMARDIVELLDCEGIEKVYGVGHDLGCPILARLANYYPERTLKYVFLDIGYIPPPIGFNADGIETINQQTLATEGFEAFGYWSFFNESSAGSVIDAHQNSLWELLYTDDPLTYWKKYFGPTGALEAFLESDSKARSGAFVSKEEERVHNRIFKPIRGGYGPALNQFRALYRDINAADEAAIPKERIYIEKPVLLLTATRDPIGSPALAERTTRPYTSDLRVKAIDSGHFLMLEKAEEVNKEMEAFFEAK